MPSPVYQCKNAFRRNIAATRKQYVVFTFICLSIGASVSLHVCFSDRVSVGVVVYSPVSFFVRVHGCVSLFVSVCVLVPERVSTWLHALQMRALVLMRERKKYDT